MNIIRMIPILPEHLPGGKATTTIPSVWRLGPIALGHINMFVSLKRNRTSSDTEIHAHLANKSISGSNSNKHVAVNGIRDCCLKTKIPTHVALTSKRSSAKISQSPGKTFHPKQAKQSAEPMYFYSAKFGVLVAWSKSLLRSK